MTDTSKERCEAVLTKLRCIVEYVHDQIGVGSVHVNAPFKPHSRVVEAADLIIALQERVEEAERERDKERELRDEIHRAGKLALQERNLLKAQLAEALEEAERVIRPLAVKKVPYRPQGNAAAYSLLFDEIRAAAEWRAKHGAKDDK